MHTQLRSRAPHPPFAPPKIVYCTFASGCFHFTYFIKCLFCHGTSLKKVYLSNFFEHYFRPKFDGENVPKITQLNECHSLQKRKRITEIKRKEIE